MLIILVGFLQNGNLPERQNLLQRIRLWDSKQAEKADEQGVSVADVEKVFMNSAIKGVAAGRLQAFQEASSRSSR